MSLYFFLVLLVISLSFKSLSSPSNYFLPWFDLSSDSSSVWHNTDIYSVLAPSVCTPPFPVPFSILIHSFFLKLSTSYFLLSNTITLYFSWDLLSALFFHTQSNSFTIFCLSFLPPVNTVASTTHTYVNAFHFYLRRHRQEGYVFDAVILFICMS